MVKKKEKIFRILAIDDEQAVLDSFKNEGRSYSIKLTGVTSLEEAQELIEEKGESYFHGFILDVVCNIKKSQTTPKPDFLQEALDYIKQIAPSSPRAIITGHSDHYGGLKQYHSGESIYSKGEHKDIETMFTVFRKDISQLRSVKVLDKYSDVFEGLNQLSTAGDCSDQLLQTILKMKEYESTAIKDNLARIRRIFESILISVSKKNENIIPTSLLDIRGEKVSLRAGPTITYLYEEGHIDPTMRSLCLTIWNVTSSYGSHANYKQPDYIPTKYTVQSLTYALMDIILWAGSVL